MVLKEFSKAVCGDEKNHTSPECNSARSGATGGASGSGAVCHMTAVKPQLSKCGFCPHAPKT